MAQELVKECRGVVIVRAMNFFDAHLQQDGKHAVILVYLDKYIFVKPHDPLLEIVKYSVDQQTQVVLVYENDVHKDALSVIL